VNVNVPDVPPPGAGFDTETMFVPPVAVSAAMIAACKLVLETNVVVRAPAFHRTVEEGTKFVPVTVIVDAAPPAREEVGLIDAIVGAGLLVVNGTPLEVPPPGTGFRTVTIAVPPAAISAAVIVACKLVFAANVVIRALPFHCHHRGRYEICPGYSQCERRATRARGIRT
jgi:hypothetical protein